MISRLIIFIIRQFACEKAEGGIIGLSIMITFNLSNVGANYVVIKCEK